MKAFFDIAEKVIPDLDKWKPQYAVDILREIEKFKVDDLFSGPN